MHILFREKQRRTTNCISKQCESNVNKCSLKKICYFGGCKKKTLKGKRDENKESEEKKMGKTLWKLETSRKWLKGYRDNAAMRDDTEHLYMKEMLFTGSLLLIWSLSEGDDSAYEFACAVFQLLKALFVTTKIFEYWPMK